MTQDRTSSSSERPAPHTTVPGPSSEHGETPLRVAMIGLRGIPATYGGVEKAVEELAEELSHRGCAVTVYSRAGYVAKGVSSHGSVSLITLPFAATKHLEAITHTALALLHALTRRKFDVIHLHATGPTLLSFVPRLAGVATVATVQGLDWRREKWGPVAKAVLRLAAWVSGRVPDATIVVSRELQEVYVESGAQRVTYVPNGVRPPATLSAAGQPHSDLQRVIGEDKPMVLFLGRLVPEKHVHTLIRAFASTDLDARLVVAGPSSNSDDYVELVEAEAAKDDRVVVVGPRYAGDKEWLLQNATVFVQPSSIEGLPLALLEAISRGAYPVVSNIPPNLEPITDRDGNILTPTVPVGDIAALGEALVAAVEMPTGERERIQLRVRDLVAAEYAWPAIADETASVYRYAVGRRKGASTKS